MGLTLTLIVLVTIVIAIVSGVTLVARALSSPPSTICKSCGHAATEQAMFCGQCGAPLIPAEKEKMR